MAPFEDTARLDNGSHQHHVPRTLSEDGTLVSFPIPEKQQNESQDLHDNGPKENASIRNFWVILSYGTKLDIFLMSVATLCSIGAGITLPLMNIVFGNLVGDFNEYFVPRTQITKDMFVESVNRNALYIVYLFVVKFFLSYVSTFCFRMTGIRISAAIRLQYLSALFAQPVSVLDQVSAGEATVMITTSSNIIQLGISEKLSVLIQSLALVVSAYAVGFRYSWALTLVSSSSMLFILIANGIIFPSLARCQRGVDRSDEEASSLAHEVFASIRTVFALSAQEQLVKRYQDWVEESRRKSLNMSRLCGIQFAPSFFAMYCNFALTFWFGLKLYRDSEISNVGAVITALFSVLLIVTALGGVATPLTGISKASSASAGLLSAIKAPKPSLTGLREPEVSAHEDVVFRDVTFAYPTRPNTIVLKDLNVRFVSGRTTAIVGPSGSGKSTLIGLLERWYQLTTSESDIRNIKPSRNEKEVLGQSIPSRYGSILIGNNEVDSLDPRWWRSQIGIVQQEPFLFDDTIYNNVAHGLVGSKFENIDEQTKRARVEQACKEVFAEEFIMKLPMGYETKVGESGTKLSGGQRQRLAIARSIIKRPAILILDEATSSIDVRGEKIVQAALDRVSMDRTTIVIAHRLSTIRNANHIVVLNGGHVAEEGTHDELLSNKHGVYHTLVHSQSLGIEDLDTGAKDMECQKLSNNTSPNLTNHGSSLCSDEVNNDVCLYKRKGIFSTVGLFLYEQRAYSLMYTFIIVAAMGCGAAYALQSYFFSQIITVFQLTGQRLVDGGNFWSLMFFILAVCIGACYFTIGYAAHSVSVHVSTTYRQEYFKSILRKPVSFYDIDENSSGALTSRLSTDPRQLQELLGANMSLPIIAIFNVLGCIAISFSFGWKLTLVTIFSALPVVFIAAFMRVRFEVQFEEMNNKVFEQSSQLAAEAIRGFRTVTSLTLEDTITRKYSTLLDQHIRNAYKKARFAFLIFALSDSIELLCMAFSFWYGGQLLASREYNVFQFFVVYAAIVQGGQAAGQFFSFAPNIAQATAAANRILSLRKVGKLTDLESLETSFPMDQTKSGARIELRNVSFKYPTRDTPIFSSLNLTIERGHFAAIVGPSGCGKSTIICLLERFYDLSSSQGSIFINETNIQLLPISTYRHSLAVVSQEPTLFQGSVRTNLLLGLDPTTISDSDIRSACIDAEIHDFIVSLPEGYNTQVTSKGSGSLLSGGQKQRLCIARALLRRPAVLLLDEATSSLDSQSEKLVQAALERVVEKRQMTVVVIAHRLATVQRADMIFVFGETKDGKGAEVVERGGHVELLRQRGMFWEMCQSQALGC